MDKIKKAPSGAPNWAAQEAKDQTAWLPDWKWHLKTLGIIYAGLIVVYFVLNVTLTRAPEPYRLREIPEEMTPWLKQ